MAEAVCQLEDGQDKLALGGPSLFEAGLESEVLDFGGIGRCCGEVVDGRGGIWLASPSVPVQDC